MFFNKKSETADNLNLLTKITALLIHAAKIDEEYTGKEREIIKKTLIDLGCNNDELENLIVEAEKTEEKSNQILEFTKEIKNLDEKDKNKIIKSLWRIIYSNKDADVYEANLMRRLSGLLYLEPKVVGDIKEKIKSNK